MKKIVLLFLLFISTQFSFSQSIPPSSIEDSVIGWMKVYHYKGSNQPMKVEAKSYSAAQLSICDSFVNWMQASYVPKGALGDVRKRVTGKLGPYNQNDAALPQSYGAMAIIYTFLKYNSSRKMVPENSLGLSWGIMANGVPGWEIRDISSPTQYYFTMPSFETEFAGDETKKIHDLSKSPNIKPYINFWIKNPEAGGGTDYVLLCKNNQSPFIKLTKGEYLLALESALPRFRELEKKKIYEANPGNQRTIDYLMKSLDEKIERFRTGLKNNREKYKNRLEEIALTNAQPSLLDLDDGRDVFNSGYLSDAESTSGRMPVYKIDPTRSELCKKDKPQWILMSWWWSPNQPVEKYMHESIINNFNFDYVYNFFFDPEKVKGQQYKPLHSPYQKEVAKINEASDVSKKNAVDRNIFFFEDFSTTEIGNKPTGWRTQFGLERSGTIKNLDGLNGNWITMAGNELRSKQLIKPLPQNFTLTFDLVAAQNFTWGAKSLSLLLAKQTAPGNAESFVKLRLRPGFDGRDGYANIETKFPFPPGYSNIAESLEAPGFSNNKKNNLISVTIKKKEETLQVFIDKTKIAEFIKAIPAAHLFNFLSFDSGGNSGENDVYYISNIKITND